MITAESTGWPAGKGHSRVPISASSAASDPVTCRGSAACTWVLSRPARAVTSAASGPHTRPSSATDTGTDACGSMMMRRSSAAFRAGSEKPFRKPCCSPSALASRSARDRPWYSRASNRSTAESTRTAKYALGTGVPAPGTRPGGGALTRRNAPMAARYPPMSLTWTELPMMPWPCGTSWPTATSIPSRAVLCMASRMARAES